MVCACPANHNRTVKCASGQGGLVCGELINSKWTGPREFEGSLQNKNWNAETVVSNEMLVNELINFFWSEENEM